MTTKTTIHLSWDAQPGAEPGWYAELRAADGSVIRHSQQAGEPERDADLTRAEAMALLLEAWVEQADPQDVARELLSHDLGHTVAADLAAQIERLGARGYVRAWLDESSSAGDGEMARMIERAGASQVARYIEEYLEVGLDGLEHDLREEAAR